jgi:predicted DNA-binding transcriptional regulator YafY
MLENNEEIIEKTEDGFLIEGFYFNDFLATQRVLSFGSKCTVIEPLEFKKTIINKIKEMRNIYE